MKSLRFGLWLLSLALFAHGAFAQPTVNASGQTSATGAAATVTLTGFSAAAGSLRFCEVWAGIGTGGTPAAPTSVTWGGNNLTLRNSALTATPFSVSKWFIKEADFPSGATGNIVATWAASHDERALMVLCTQGVDQTNPYRNASQQSEDDGGSTSPSVTVTSNAADLVTAGIWVGATSCAITAISATAGTEETGADTGPIAGGCEIGTVATVAGSSPTVTFSVSMTGSPDATLLLADSLQAGATYDLDQFGFRWGVDDDTESAHTFEAAENTDITIADNQSRLLRIGVEATTGDPGAIAYTLRYQKNGSGGYVAVPVGASTKVTPVIESGDATETGNNTATTSWAVGYPNASTGDLLIFCISWDDSTATTDVTEPAGPNSEVLSEVNATPATDSGTETRAKCWYTVATGTWTASTLTFTPGASEQWTGVTVRVPAGEFDASTPIGGSDVNNTAGATDTNVLNAAFTAGASDGSGKLITWTSADVDPQTVASGWGEVANEDRGAVSGGFFTRDTAVSDSESITAGTVATIASDSWASVSFVVRAPTVNNEVYIATSANITAGGEATTARLTDPGNDFVTGRRWDDENGTDTIDITDADYSEFEWLVFIASSAANDDFFDFQAYAGTTAFDTYTETPRWTIPGAGGSSALLHRRRNH